MKKALRYELKSKRDALENRELLSSVIAESFITSDIYKEAEVLLLYYSVGSEVSTDKILKQALNDKKRVAYPVCIDNSGYMEFYFIKTEDDLVEGMYKIKAPKQGSKKFSNENNSVCIVPALAFDIKGNRLGYGKGYYDRFLEKFKGISVGICYDAMLADSIPADPHDKKVSYLITDKKTYNFTNKEDFKYG